MARIHTTLLRLAPQVLPTPLIRALAIPIRIGLESRGAGGKGELCRSKKRPNLHSASWVRLRVWEGAIMTAAVLCVAPFTPAPLVPPANAAWKLRCF